MLEDDKDFSYGVLKYSSINIGDEIQSVAAMRFLPRVDEYVHREQINSFVPKKGKKTKLIMNAWWMWQPENFPPSEYIDPLLISMFIREEIRDTFLTPEVRKYFLDHGPVGCRDLSTCDWLNSEGIPAYFSGCLTLTLKRNWKVKREKYILCVDIPQAVVKEIKSRTNRPVHSVSRMLSPFYTSKQRIQVAKLFLRLYHNAHCVVSSRLHAVMPSLAFETPVLRLITGKDEMGIKARFTGMEDFVNTITLEDFMNNKNCYNFNRPPKNPKKHLKVRDELIKKCSEFTGYDRKKSFIIHHIDPLLELFKISQYSNKQVDRLLYWASKEQLENNILTRDSGFTKYDMDY